MSSSYSLSLKTHSSLSNSRSCREETEDNTVTGWPLRRHREVSGGRGGPSKSQEHVRRDPRELWAPCSPAPVRLRASHCPLLTSHAAASFCSNTQAWVSPQQCPDAKAVCPAEGTRLLLCPN